MFNSRIILSRLPIQYNHFFKNNQLLKNKKEPISYGEYYLKNKDKKKTKQERMSIIKAFYDYILR